MKPIDPINVIYPQKHIKKVIRVLHDGTKNIPNEFSLAEIELQSGEICFGIRHNINRWNDNNPEIGFPTCRPGNPTWFILPEMSDFLLVMNKVFNK